MAATVFVRAAAPPSEGGGLEGLPALNPGPLLLRPERTYSRGMSKDASDLGMVRTIERAGNVPKDIVPALECSVGNGKVGPTDVEDLVTRWCPSRRRC